ncbi:hypothetical protein [Streptoalloteichus tenebrarius]|nr:hypothetical protein [Streptoalloteichus tenebrarius]
MTFRVRRPRWLPALVGTALALGSVGAPAVAAEPTDEHAPLECQDGWCPETLPADPPSLGVHDVAAVHGDVWAVGYASGSVPLALRWDGKTWQSTARPQTEHVELHGVAGWSRHDVWAVGTRGGVDAGTTTFTQHWDGREWTVVPSPNPDGSRNELRAVAVAGPHDVWAVGETGDPFAGSRPLLLHWDGHTWSAVPTPLSDQPATFRTVVARSPHDVWVGALVGEDLRTQVGVTLRWDGRTWQRIDVPDQDPASTIAMGADLDGRPLLTLSKTVGKYSDRSRVWHWTGSAWTRLAVPAIDGQNLGIASMTDDRRGRVWMAGRTGGGAGLVVGWDGRQWTSTLFSSGGRGSLSGVTASPSGQEVWVGGGFGTGRHRHGVVYVRR